MKAVLLLSCLLAVLVSVLAVGVAPDASLPRNMAAHRRIVNKINKDATSTWTSGLNGRFLDLTDGEIKRQMGALATPPAMRAAMQMRDYGHVKLALPDTFDARQQWPQCPSIGSIRDQSACGSCWAHGAVEAATDRICIETNGTQTLMISANDLTACCTTCGYGCGGGYLPAAWAYLATTGIVTGGNYNDSTTSQWCQKYTLPNCAHHEDGLYERCPSPEYDTPVCSATCDASTKYPMDYVSDHRKFHNSYLVKQDITAIQTEIFLNGPVEAAFTVYEDFLTYKSGVYQHKTGASDGGHAVKLIGWGTESGTDYWLVANSWNEGWGDRGFFKIRRGVNECGIEDGIVAGMYLAQSDIYYQ